MRMALEMFEMMKSQGISPNDVTYNSMIDVCVRCDQMNRAWALLNEMQEQNIIPDNFTYSTLIKGIRADSSSQGPISNQNDLERAFTLLELMKKQN